MEKITKTISQVLQPQDFPHQEKALAASDISASHIELTPEEKEKVIQVALNDALQAKINAHRQAEYWERVKNPPALPSFTSSEFLKICIGRFLKQTGEYFILDDNNIEQAQALSEYFTSDPNFEKRGEGFKLSKGIYLYGNVGCGKTTMMKLFAINPLQSYVVISARKVASDFTSGGDDGKGGYSAIERYFGIYIPEYSRDYFRHQDLGFCFDDLGTETEKQSFGNKSNVLGEVLLNRYDQGHKLKNRTHITSNLSAQEVEQVYGVRVRSRMREMFNLIEFNASSPDRR